MVVSGFNTHKVSADTEITKFDGVNVSAVYVGTLTNLMPAKLKWRKRYFEFMGDDIEVLTLGEIAEQLKDMPIINVFCQSSFSGEIYQYGNHGDSRWWQIGATCGYA